MDIQTKQKYFKKLNFVLVSWLLAATFLLPPFTLIQQQIYFTLNAIFIAYFVTSSLQNHQVIFTLQSLFIYV